MLIKSPAKINLFLYVTGRRDNGYHDLCSLMVPVVDLYDEIELTFFDPITEEAQSSINNIFQPKSTYQNALKIKIRCDNLSVPSDHSNLAFKAASLFNNNLSTVGDIVVREIAIEIKKKIPIGAGLGGGSSNAASILKTMNHFYGSPFSMKQLMEMGLKLGADVPFFILEKAAIAEGIGEKLTPVHLQLDGTYILLFYPGLSASTADVYKNLDLALTKAVKSNIKSFLKISGNDQGFIMRLKEFMHNDLELTTCALYPDIGSFRKELIDSLPEKVMMTGSGSTFFSLFSDYEKAQRCFNELSLRWRDTNMQVFISPLYAKHNI